MNSLERRRDKIIENYNILSKSILSDNSILNEKERILIHDDIWNKVTEICWFVMFIDRNNPNCEYKNKIISHEKYVLSTMFTLKKQFNDILIDLDLDFFKFNSIEEISEYYLNKTFDHKENTEFNKYNNQEEDFTENLSKKFVLF